MRTDANNHLGRAIAHLERLAGGANILTEAACALRLIAVAAFDPEPADPAQVAQLSTLLFDAAARVAESAGDGISHEHIYIGLGCASAIAKCQDPHRKDLLAEYALLLKADLIALAIRRDIISRGDPDLVEAVHLYADPRARTAARLPASAQPVFH